MGGAGEVEGVSIDFLPQFAAQAVIDLRHLAKQSFVRAQSKYYPIACEEVANLICDAVHVMLPANGEIYRDNPGGGAMPSKDECESFAGLPAPITCFEYPWTHRTHIKDGDLVASKRITLVCDGKQTDDGPIPAGMVACATFFSVFYDEVLRSWALSDTSLVVAQPLVAAEGRNGRPDHWGVEAAARNLVTGEDLWLSKVGHPTDQSISLMERIMGNYKADITAVIQCCHALRAGASFTERTEPSGSRRRKFARHDVGGFTYHVLRLPQHAQNGSPLSMPGTHAPPRLHIRRAHIRKLQTGRLTFVRQCFVGSADAGVVHKTYAVSR
jgi:hypothetical protein